MANTKTEAKLKAQEYSTAARATFAISRSKLTPKEKKRLQEMVPQYYPEVSDPPDSDPPETAAFNGDVVRDITKAIQSSDKEELDRSLMRMSIQLLGLALKHRLTREQIFDRLKSTLHAGMG